MSNKKVQINLKFIKFEVTLAQFVMLIFATILTVWFIFNLSFSLNIGVFSCDSKPVHIKTDQIQIGTSQKPINKEVKK